MIRPNHDGNSVPSLALPQGSSQPLGLAGRVSRPSLSSTRQDGFCFPEDYYAGNPGRGGEARWKKGLSSQRVRFSSLLSFYSDTPTPRAPFVPRGRIVGRRMRRLPSSIRAYPGAGPLRVPGREGPVSTGSSGNCDDGDPPSFFPHLLSPGGSCYRGVETPVFSNIPMLCIYITSPR